MYEVWTKRFRIRTTLEFSSSISDSSVLQFIIVHFQVRLLRNSFNGFSVSPAAECISEYPVSKCSQTPPVIQNQFLLYARIFASLYIEFNFGEDKEDTRG